VFEVTFDRPMFLILPSLEYSVRKGGVIVSKGTLTLSALPKLA
jgi:hypothetical protein